MRTQRRCAASTLRSLVLPYYGHVSLSFIHRRTLKLSALSPFLTPKDVYWKGDVAAHRSYVEEVGKELGVAELADWYKIHRGEVKKVGGPKFFGRYSGLFQVLRVVYPDYHWKSNLFSNVGWEDPESQRKLLDRVGKKLGIKELSDWYSIQRSTVTQNGGGPLFSYHPSLAEALKAAYPDYPWEKKRFVTGSAVPAGYWKEKSNLLEALQKAEETLGIKQPEDWYSVTLADLTQVGLFPRSLSKVQLAELLGERYPDYRWEKMVLLKGRYGEQRRLEKAIQLLFPDVEIKYNARKEGGIVDPTSSLYLELDILIPSLKLAFEYQDKHHWISESAEYQPLQWTQDRDKVKKEVATQQGLTLIAVPCWWDLRKESLVATIRQARPDLLVGEPADDTPIPAEAPPNFFDKHIPHVEGIGQPSLACFFTLSSIDPTGWLMFEKYDGVRGLWNPVTKKFYSRWGNKLSIPQNIIDTMPSDTFLDGELWFGRENFQEAIKMSRRLDNSGGVDWSKFTFMVFDIPNDKGTYQERYQKLATLIQECPNQYLGLAECCECTGVDHMEKYFQDLIDKGGEGIILRDPKAPYQEGRSAGYLKHKRFRDAEARIIGSVGQYQWECELPNGTRFTASAGTSEFAKRWNPQPGDIVSFKHRGFLLATKKPKLPTLYRLRTDLKWEDVVNNWKDQKPSIRVSPFRKNRKAIRRRKAGYWRSIENRRNFFLEFAESQGFDPLVPANWTNVNKEALQKAGFMANTPLKRVLKETFPELDFSVLKERKSWDPASCRKFFDDYAKEKGVNALDVHTWYMMNLHKLRDRPSGTSISQRYGGFHRALQAAYPELAFTKWKLGENEYSKWADAELCRSFFDQVAQERGKEPRHADTWYNFPLKELNTKKGVDSLRRYHRGLRNAIRHAYPEIEFARWN